LGVSLSKGLAEKLEEILKQHSDQPQVQFYSSVNETKSSNLVNENPSEEKKSVVQSFVLQHNDQPITNSKNTQLNIDDVTYGNELQSLLDGEFESTPILNKTSNESSQVVALIHVSKEKLNQGIWLLFTDKSNSPDISGKSNAQTVNEGIGNGKILLDLDSTTLPKIDEQYLTELPKQVLENLSETLLHNSDVKVNEEDGIQDIIQVLNSSGSGDDKAQNLEESLKPKSTNQQSTVPIPNTEKVSELRNIAGFGDDKAQNLEESLKPKSTNQQSTVPIPNTEKVSELRNTAGFGDDKAQNLDESLKLKSTNQQTTAPIPNTEKVSELRNTAGFGDDKAQNLEESIKPKSTNQQTTAPNQNTEKVSELRNTAGFGDDKAQNLEESLKPKSTNQQTTAPNQNTEKVGELRNTAGFGDDKAQNLEESLKPKSTNQQTTAPNQNTEKVSELRNTAGFGDDKAQNLEESLKPKSTNQQTTAPNPNTEKVNELRNTAGFGDDKAQNLEESLKPKSTNQLTTTPNPNTEKVSEPRNTAGSGDDKAPNLEENEVTLKKINFPEKVKTTGSEVQNSEDIESKDKIKGPNKFVFISNETMKSLSNLARSENKSMNFTTTEEVNNKPSTVKPILSDVNIPKVSLAQAQNTNQPTGGTLENKPIPSKEGLTPVAKLILNSAETTIVNNEIGLREKQLSLKDYSEPFNQVSNPQKNAGNLEKVIQTQKLAPEELQETSNKPFNLLNSEDVEIFTNNKEKNKLSRNTNINRISITQPTHSNQSKETPTQINSFQGMPGEKIVVEFQEDIPKNIKEFENAINSGKDDQKADSTGIKSETVINPLTKAQQDKTHGSENKLTQPTFKNDVMQMNFQKIDQPDNILKTQNKFDKPTIPLSNENIKDAIEQIVQSTKLHLTKDAQKISVQLKPEFLGMAKIVVESSEQEVKAILYIERPEVRNVLERQVIQIHKSLQDQNIRVDKIEVQDFSSQFSKDGTNNPGRDGRQMLETDRHNHELGSQGAMVNSSTIDDFDKRDFGYNTIELTA